MSLAELVTRKKQYITFKEVDSAVEAAAGVVKPRLEQLPDTSQTEEDLKSVYAYAVTYAIAYKSAGTPPSFVLANQSVAGPLKQRLKARGLDPESIIEAANLAIQNAIRQQQSRII